MTDIPADRDFEQSVIRKIRRRLLPFMFVLFVVCYLDRINVGFAALQMNESLGLGPAVYGLGAGLFFIGYFLFEIPSNLILQRIGARIWIARIMISWGIISSAMMFVTGQASFYTLRFLLGLAEAGFFPGMILYLTYWFPGAERARAGALFMTGTAIAGVVGGPISGALLSMDGLGGLEGWQWLFLLEGVPAVVLGFMVLGYLDNGPEEARWLTASERSWVVERLKQERAITKGHDLSTLRQALSNGRVWLLAALYFFIIVSLYGVGLWLPQLIRRFSGRGDLAVGLLSAVPYCLAAIGMVMIGAHSDRMRERRRHVAVPALAGAAGLVAGAFSGQPALSLLSLCLAAVGIWGTLGPFWTLPPAFLNDRALAGGIALINSIGNLGGFVGPSLVGVARTITGDFRGGLIVLALSLSLGAALALVVCTPPAREPRGRN